ncbi:enoyl-CoA hydratase/isomerase family protein [Marinobacter flavimaris]|uniref:Enoyl-CoA hydratase/isomerase family protein n=1 Tax=Marinobacter flavimaris TaxID=262076 RepID=A0A3D8GXU7_9GAMM|nr:enoyl-CoA hydratase/isomerase family protein [Marinobacter flavimaris]PPI78352.1 enoyl-CoA hydratase/isomerase family protein [Marinobacter flavimaris]RDU39021.1 enoyl-CoA hydratase/isomerase family protein [Marinobacter flavimaris]
MNKLIETEQHGRIVIAKFSNPPYALLTESMCNELNKLIVSVDRDPTIGVVVFTGHDPNRFISHYDVGELLEGAESSPPMSLGQAKFALTAVRALKRLPGMRRLLQKSPAAGLLQLQNFHETLQLMGRSGTIFIAAINGQTAGGGLEFALACDLRFMSDSAELAQFEVLLGFPPGAGGTQRLSRLIGRGVALELMLTGRGISPKECLSLGLVSEVIPHEDLLNQVLRRAEPLSHRSKAAVAGIKQSVIEGGSLALEQGLRLEQSLFLSLLGASGAKRASKAYVDFIDSKKVLPVNDPVARKKLEAGSFVDLTDR